LRHKRVEDVEKTIKCGRNKRGRQKNHQGERIIKPTERLSEKLAGEAVPCRWIASSYFHPKNGSITLNQPDAKTKHIKPPEKNSKADRSIPDAHNTTVIKPKTAVSTTFDLLRQMELAIHDRDAKWGGGEMKVNDVEKVATGANRNKLGSAL